MYVIFVEFGLTVFRGVIVEESLHPHQSALLIGSLKIMK